MRTFCDETGRFPCFFKQQPVYDLDQIQLRIAQYDVLATNSPVSLDGIFLELRKIESQKERHYKPDSGRKTRYGSHIIGLLPHGNWSKSKKQKIIKTFAEAVISEEKLLYFAWEEVIGIARYLHVYFTDREWLPYRAIHYKRDVWQDANGQLCTKHTPGARLTRRKGEVKDYVSAGFSITKSRIFSYKDLEDFKKRFEDFWILALQKMKTIAQGTFLMARKKLHFEMARYLKRVYIHQNHLMTYIENILNLLYEPLYPDDYEVHRHGGSPGESLKSKNHVALEEIYNHYRSRFKHNKFHYKGEVFYLNGRADLADANIEYLKQIFDKEISDKFPGQVLGL